jgi:hypothetical protein
VLGALVWRLGRERGVEARMHCLRSTPPIEEIVMANLERLNRFADDLLDGRLGFDRWPLRMPTEAPLRAR